MSATHQSAFGGRRIDGVNLGLGPVFFHGGREVVVAHLLAFVDQQNAMVTQQVGSDGIASVDAGVDYKRVYDR